MIRVVLREVLRDQGVSTTALAARAGLRRQTVRDLADGRTTRIDLTTLSAIMRALELDRVGTLLQWSDGEQPPLARPRRVRRKPRPKLPPCGHRRPSSTCYDCLYPPGDPDRDESQVPRTYHREGDED